MQEIVNYIGRNLAPAPVVAKAQPVVIQTVISSPEPVTNDNGQQTKDNGQFISSELSQRLLQVVSEKTGYPINMLSLEMDMEADLGIDSINRVEILAGMQDHFPDLPKINPEVLADLCRLQEIVDYIQNNALTTSAVSQPSVVPVAVARVQASATNLKELEQVMLAVVSEKTGYPSDMLSLEMDMEADLGIDSINRVEILAGVQERYPSLPKINPDELAELRTLQEIIQHLGRPTPHANGKNGVSAEIASPHPAPLLQPHPDPLLQPHPDPLLQPHPDPLLLGEGEGVEEPLPEHGIVRSTVRLKSLAQPDFMAFELPAGQVCVLTDDGSAASIQTAQKLRADGLAVVVLSFPSYVVPSQNHWPTDIARVNLNDLSESHLQQQLAAIAQSYGTIGAFIHLSPTREASQARGIYFSEAEKALAKHIFLIAKHIKKAVTENAGRFMTIARLDGALGTQPTAAGFSVIDGSLFGLTKTLNQEWPTVYCRALDLAPTLTAAQVAQTVWTELHDPNRLLVEVGYGAQGRVTLALS